MKLPSAHFHEKIIRFLVVGATAFIVDFVCASLFIIFMPRVPSLVLAYMMSCIFHYTSSKYWAFDDSSPLSVRQVWLYALVNIATLVINTSITNLMLGYSNQGLLIAKAVALPPSSILGFVLLRWLVFKNVKTKSVT